MATTQLAFDAQFYLTQNPDVAAAVSRGQFASAEQHYNLNGRFENRDPNAFFDTSYYLGQYPDVAAARVNPFQHFLQFGSTQAEARFANAAAQAAIDTDGNGFGNEFNAAAYLAANPDVAANTGAGKSFATAYQHYVISVSSSRVRALPLVVRSRTLAQPLTLGPPSRSPLALTTLSAPLPTTQSMRLSIR